MKNEFKQSLLDMVVAEIHGISQTEAGVLLGVSQGEVSRLISGKTTAKIETLMGHLEILGYNFVINDNIKELNMNIGKPSQTKFSGGGAFYIADVDEDGNRISEFKPMGQPTLEPLTFKLESSEVEYKDIEIKSTLDKIMEKGLYSYTNKPDGAITFNFNMEGFVKNLTFHNFEDELHELIEAIDNKAVELYRSFYLGMGDFDEIKDDFMATLHKYNDIKDDE